MTIDSLGHFHAGKQIVPRTTRIRSGYMERSAYLPHSRNDIRTSYQTCSFPRSLDQYFGVKASSNNPNTAVTKLAPQEKSKGYINGAGLFVFQLLRHP